MRAEPKKDKKGKLLESDECEIIVNAEKKTVCGRRTSWKCDRCKRWVCHQHFSTFHDAEYNIKEICYDCQKEIGKE
jgi:esterase/lipase superfamily enzyme